MTGCTGHYHEPGCPHFDQPAEAPSAVAERIAETTQHVVEVLGGTRHSADCVRSALPANYDRGGVGLTMPSCTCGHDDAVARAVAHMQTQEAIISDLRAENHWLTTERDDATARADGYALLVAGLRAALAWYADERNYDAGPVASVNRYDRWPVVQDAGERARAILTADPEARASELLATEEEGQ